MTIFDELKARGLLAQLTDEEEIKELVNQGKATFYIGFDPTADSLHVGHFMALCLMKRLQMAGNKPIALLGGGTGMVGDPSGRSDMRNMMSKETIEHNCECFKKQMSRFIDFSEGKALMVNNAEWLLDLNYIEFLREIGPHFSVNRMLTAECYKQRMEKGLSFLEFNYMLMQSYDFYELFQRYGCNMQFGGDDQWSNMLGGTELIRRKLGKDAYAMTITLLLNSEGNKMGKTQKGAVWLDPQKTSPFEFYQYWRNVADADVLKFIRMLTFLPLGQIEEMDSWEGSQLNQAKEVLAYELTQLVHGEEEAVARQIERIHAEEASLYYNNEQALRSVIKRAYFSYGDEYMMFEELPSGAGYADIVYLPKKGSMLPALVVELKWNKSAEGAIRQIHEKRYPKAIEGYGGEILLVGISYSKEAPAGRRQHHCRIERVEGKG